MDPCFRGFFSQLLESDPSSSFPAASLLKGQSVELLEQAQVDYQYLRYSRNYVGSRPRGGILSVIVAGHMFSDHGNIIAFFFGQQQS